jgi:hypothetical protein
LSFDENYRLQAIQLFRLRSHEGRRELRRDKLSVL